MTELDNDKLIRDFFAAEKKEIVDNGFSHRVMRHLPDRENRLARTWTIIVMIIAVILFILLGGVEASLGTLREVFSNMITHLSNNLDPKSIIIAAIVLLFMAARKICSLA